MFVENDRSPSRRRRILILLAISSLVVVAVLVATMPKDSQDVEKPPVVYQPRKAIETSGFLAMFKYMDPWSPDATSEENAATYARIIPDTLIALDFELEIGRQSHDKLLMAKANLLNARGAPAEAYKVLSDLESHVRGSELEGEWLYTILYYKGVTALRQGENDNCVMCRGQSACIFPISKSAIHANVKGSRGAVEHFTEYLRSFPDDFEVKWLLNVAHMTLGEYPAGVDPRFLLPVAAFGKSEFDIGVLHDVSHRVGLYDRINQSGGAIMDDFDNDGLFDIVVTSWAPSETMAFFRNKGDGTFEERTTPAGLNGIRGGLYCVQTDYNNDGQTDIFIPRGSWMQVPNAQRPILLRNNGNGAFTDVSREAGFTTATNSTSAGWADYDNDGFLDVFICCQNQPCLLYRNTGDGRFEEVAARAGLPANLTACLGSAWIDFDNDGWPDLFTNHGKGFTSQVDGTAQLFRNNRNGTFTEVTKEMGIEGPTNGFSCWAFDFDNDGWMDIFAGTINHTLEDVVKGLIDQPHKQPLARLYRNLGGKKFQDVTREFGLDKVYAPMGSNFGDLDNDGYLDFYLGTGNPTLEGLMPNRLFKNVDGKRFAEITGSSRTGHLQKGHGVAFGDWDRNGTQDLFIELGGAIPGDSYHNVLFQNPGHGNNWLSVKLTGSKTNRAAIGARITVVTGGPTPRMIHRRVSSGSSFGANPLEQHIGLGKAERVDRIEIAWPVSGSTQVFRDVAVNQGIVIEEFKPDHQRRTGKNIRLPE